MYKCMYEWYCCFLFELINMKLLKEAEFYKELFKDDFYIEIQNHFFQMML